jgi:hypothetical protein
MLGHVGEGAPGEQNEVSPQETQDLHPAVPGSLSAQNADQYLHQCRRSRSKLHISKIGGSASVSENGSGSD